MSSGFPQPPQVHPVLQPATIQQGQAHQDRINKENDEKKKREEEERKKQSGSAY